MKYEAIQAAQAEIDAAQAALTLANQHMSEALALPNDPPPALPTGLAIIGHYGDPESTLTLEIDFAAIESGCEALLDYIGTPENPHGPQSWTPIPVNAVASAVPKASLNIHNAAGQSLILRLQARRLMDNQYSPDAVLAISANDYSA